VVADALRALTPNGAVSHSRHHHPTQSSQPPPASLALDGAAQTSICTLFTYAEIVHTMPAGQSESLTQSCCCPLMHVFPNWHTPPPGPNGKPGGPPAPPMQQTCPEPQLPGALH